MRTTNENVRGPVGGPRREGMAASAAGGAVPPGAVAVERLRCGAGHHRIVWDRHGPRLVDEIPTAEAVLAALGGPVAACVERLGQWRRHGVRGIDMLRWVAGGHRPSEALRWLDAGVGLAEASAWRDAGFGLNRARRWRGADFDRVEAARWRAAGVGPVPAMALRANGLHAEAARSLLAAGATPSWIVSMGPIHDLGLVHTWVGRPVPAADLAAVFRHGLDPDDLGPDWRIPCPACGQRRRARDLGRHRRGFRCEWESGAFAAAGWRRGPSVAAIFDAWPKQHRRLIPSESINHRPLQAFRSPLPDVDVYLLVRAAQAWRRRYRVRFAEALPAVLALPADQLGPLAAMAAAAGRTSRNGHTPPVPSEGLAISSRRPEGHGPSTVSNRPTGTVPTP